MSRGLGVAAVKAEEVIRNGRNGQQEECVVLSNRSSVKPIAPIVAGWSGLRVRQRDKPSGPRPGGGLQQCTRLAGVFEGSMQHGFGDIQLLSKPC